MAELSDQIENALNEARMLILGGQVLLGFSYRICFEPAFDRLFGAARLAQVISLAIMTGTMGWLIWPAAYHRIAESGRESSALQNFTSRVLDGALLPLGIALGLSFYPVCVALRLPHPQWIGAGAATFAVLSWYGGLLHPRRGKSNRLSAQHGQDESEKSNAKQPELTDRIKKVLIECRMALPGAQAFLGFQFAIVFADAFDRLPHSSQLIHFGALVATTISIVLLIAPAAYHRLAERGQDTENFLKVASRFLLAGLVFLAPGMTGDLLVVLRMVTGSFALASAVAVLMMLGFFALWFGISLAVRKKKNDNQKT